MPKRYLLAILYFTRAAAIAVFIWVPLSTTSALLFGVAHGSIYRMLPVTFLGIVFGYLAWQSKSVIPGMLAHAINNGLAAVLVSYEPLRTYVAAQNMTFLPWQWSAVGAVVLTAGILLARNRDGDAAIDQSSR